MILAQAFFRIVVCLTLPVFPIARLDAQLPTDKLPEIGRDSVVVIAGSDFAAGRVHRWLLGNNYRDAWTTPIKVPVLDLHLFAGGLEPRKSGGGFKTISLTFVAPDSTEWVFRSVHKHEGVLPKEFEGTVIWYIFSDGFSASHPTGFRAAEPLMDAVGELHPRARLAVMPDDPALGKFRKEFAGMLGAIERRPLVPKGAPAFAGAGKIINSEKLLEDVDSDPFAQVDARALLTARLVDLVLGDNDRHPNQWKWARFGKKDDVRWIPIGVDHDKAFLSYGGILIKLARIAVPSLVTFDSTLPSPTALFHNAMEFDRRLLGGLDKSVWDSVATSVSTRLTNAVIDSSMRMMPGEYAPSLGQISSKLKARRSHLQATADNYYATLSRVVDIHGTDSADKATVVRAGDGLVDVQIRFRDNPPSFNRRFKASETSEIRLYLHEGDDTALVTGNVLRSIPVRIIGGNGNNVLVDQSTVGGRRNQARFYDVGNVTDVVYAVDSEQLKTNANDAVNDLFNRRPWLHHYGKLIPPQRDYGVSLAPTGKINSGRGLGYVPRIGFSRYTYGFRDVPYSNLFKADLGYSTGHGGLSINVLDDKRFEDTDVHVPVTAQYSQLELVEFRGFGNDVPDSRRTFYNVRQTQRNFRPAVGFSFNPVSDISIGPIVRYTTTDSIANRFISQLNPYGVGNFGQAGLQLRAHYETRYVPDTLKPRGVFELNGSTYPSAWDLKSAYSSIDGFAAAFFTIPVAKRPVLALRAGGKKLFGDFPYFDAAFLGGSSSLRAEERQQYAGDEAIYGNSEIRLPVAQFPFILPLDVGLIGFADAGRVYVNGDSPGGWHSAVGGGFWVGFANPGTNINVLLTNNSDRRVVSAFGFAF